MTNGCAATQGGEPETPALLVDATESARAAMQDFMRRTSGRSLTMSASRFRDSAQYVWAERAEIGGMDMRTGGLESHTFELRQTPEGCALIHIESGARETFEGVRCAPF